MQLGGDSLSILLQRMDAHAKAARDDLAVSTKAAKRDNELLLAALVDTNSKVLSLDERISGVVADVQVQQKALDGLSCVAGDIQLQKDALAALKEDQQDSNARRDRHCDVTIKGLPLSGRESAADLRSIVINVAKAVGLFLSGNDVVHVFRIGIRSTSGRDSLIIARFGSLGIRAAFFRQYMAVPDGLDATALGYKTRSRIYVSDNLTKKNSTIRARAVVLKRTGVISGHTVRDGLVFVTLLGENRKREIHSIAELEGLANLNQSCDAAGRSSLNDGPISMNIDIELDPVQLAQPGPQSGASVLASNLSDCSIVSNK